MNHQHEHWLAATFLLMLTLLVARSAPGQNMRPPPNNGFNATIVLPETIDAFYTGLNKGLEEMGDGIDALTGSSKDSTSHGGALEDLRPGTRVVMQYTVKGIQASSDVSNSNAGDAAATNEGTVIGVDHDRKRVTIKFAVGPTQTFKAADETERDSSRVILYRADDPAPRRPHYFKPRAR